MTASIWNGSTVIASTANADSSYKSQRFVATVGQTVFTLTAYVYAPATGSLLVFINGVDQYLALDFTETTSSSITLVTPAKLGDVVVIRGLVGSTGATSAATSAAASAASAAAALASYNAILALSLPSLPLVISSGGTGQITKLLGFNALSPITTKGDVITGDGTNNIRVGVGANGTSLVADSTVSAGVKWAMAGVGTGGALVSGSVVLTAASAGCQYITTTIPGQTVTLPDATTSTKAATLYAITCQGDFDLWIKDNAGNYLGVIHQGNTCCIGLADNAGAAGVWALDVGADVVGIEAQSQVTLSTTSSGTNTKIVILDANRTLLFLSGTTNLQAVVYDASTGTSGAVAVVRTASISSKFSATLVSTDKVLVWSCDGTTNSEAVILTMISSAITVNAAVPVTLATNFTWAGEFVNITGGSVLGYCRTNVTVAIAITVSGTVPTVGAENIQTSVVASFPPVVYQTSGAVCVMFSADNTLIYARPMTLGGSTLTTGTQASTATTNNTSSYAHLLASGRWGLVTINTTLFGTVLDVTGTVATFSAQVQLATLTPTSTGISTQLVGSQLIVAAVNNAAAVQFNILTDSAGTAVAGTLAARIVPSNTPVVSPLGVYGSEARFAVEDASTEYLYMYRVTISAGNPVLGAVKSALSPSTEATFTAQQQSLTKETIPVTTLKSGTQAITIPQNAILGTLARSSGFSSRLPMNIAVTSGLVRGSTNGELWEFTTPASGTLYAIVQKVRLV